MMKAKAQSYSQYCSQFDLWVDKPEAPTTVDNPECFYVEVNIQFKPAEDTFPKLFYADYFTLSGVITNGVITDINHNFSSVTTTADDDDSFDLIFGNSNNMVDMDSYLTVTIETEPGADFQLNVYASDFGLNDNAGNDLSFLMILQMARRVA